MSCYLWTGKLQAVGCKMGCWMDLLGIIYWIACLKQQAKYYILPQSFQAGFSSASVSIPNWTSETLSHVCVIKNNFIQGSRTLSNKKSMHDSDCAQNRGPSKELRHVCYIILWLTHNLLDVPELFRISRYPCYWLVHRPPSQIQWVMQHPEHWPLCK